MKTSKNTLFFLFIVFTIIPFLKTEAQVRIGGQIDINIGIPEVVVINRRAPRPAPAPRKRRPVVIRERIPAPVPTPREIVSLGTIMNQNNGPRFDYYVVDTHIKAFRNNELDLTFNLDTGDILTITMLELNPNDYNYHFYKRPNAYNNTILNIKLNGNPIALNSASVSLQPIGRNGYTAVLNIHSIRHGDYNGTINSLD